MTRYWPMAMMQIPTAIYMISGFMNSVRIVYLDGRKHTDLDIIVRTYNGESIGTWEGDTLVVDTIGFRGDHHWMDQGGVSIPAGEQLHIVERFRMVGNQLEIEYTMTDPDNWEGEWKSTKRFNRVDRRGHSGSVVSAGSERAPAEHDVENAGTSMKPPSYRRCSASALADVRRLPRSAQVSFVGDWSGRYHEDQPDRVPGEEPGDFSGLPINDAARMFGDSWDVARHSVLEHQCAPYTLPYMFFGPNQFRILEDKHPDTQELIAIKMYMGTYQQRRTIWLDGRPHPPEYAPHTFMGFSTGEWNGDILTITTTHIKAGYFRRGGMPASDRTTVVEHWMRHGNLLSQVTIATDPVYLTEPYIRSQEFVQMERGNQNWLYNCEYAMEVPKDKNEVPHYLPGQNPWLGEFEAKHAMPKEGVRGGAETLLPEWKPGAAKARPNPAKNGGFRPEVLPQRLAAGEVKAVHVQGNVHMIVGAGDQHRRAGRRGRHPRRRHRRGGATRQGAGRDQGARADKEIRWIINTGDAGRSHRRQRGGREGRPDGERQRGRHRGARERRVPDDQGRRARRVASVQHLLRRARATSRSTASR